MPRPAVLQNPVAGACLKRGFDTLANALALTLGPSQGAILVDSLVDSRPPEIISDAATIARRVIELPHRAEDVGAMMLRHLAWRTHLKAGDGTATAVVLAQAILNHAHRFAVGGANPMLLRRGIERATAAANAALRRMARPVQDEETLISIAEAVTGDPHLSLILGEMFDILGQDAHITIEKYVAPYLEREYIEGGRWKGQLASPYFVSDVARRRAILPACHVVIFDGKVETLADVQPMLELIVHTEPHRVLLAARDIKGEALSTLVVNHQKDDVKVKIIASELRRAGKQPVDFEDLAVLTGATVLGLSAGRPLRTITAQDLGTAQRVEADSNELIVVGDQRQSAAVRERIETLRAQMDTWPEDDDDREDLRFRVARLSGNIGVLKIGAASKAEREVLEQKAEKALKALPLAVHEGVVPGGGVAYVNCIPAVRQLKAELAGEEAWGAETLAQALEEPFRCIARNAGATSPGVLLAEAQRLGPGFGYDAMTKQIVNMEEAGILDAVGVLRQALEIAVSGAIMAFTTETIVIKREPQTSTNP
jgi:chaperonin GroEL